MTSVFVGAVDDFQAVAKPLYGRARDENRAFERIGGGAVQLIGDGGEEAVFGCDGDLPRVEHNKTARTVCGFDHAGGEAGLADCGGVLVARDA